VRSTLIFLAFYAVTQSLFIATSLAIAFAVGQTAYYWAKGKPIYMMQWLSLALLIVFGGASLITHNTVFIKLKPTLIYVVIGAFMLRPRWMERYVPPIALRYGTDIVFIFGYIWAALMFVTALANIILAILAPSKNWAWFIGVFPIASKAGLALLQYGVSKMLIRRRVRLASV
jgi:intracellular septation protein A